MTTSVEEQNSLKMAPATLQFKICLSFETV